MWNYHENIFKGESEEEIKCSFNQKWLYIIKNCVGSKNTFENPLLQKNKHDIITPIAKQYCSANLQEEELNNYE